MHDADRFGCGHGVCGIQYKTLADKREVVSMADKSVGRVRSGRSAGKRSDAGQPVAQARKKINFRFIRSEIDRPFFILVLVLLAFGILMMFSASYAWGLSESGDGYQYVR